MGYCPDWYPLIRAAKYLGVAPWDLLAQHPVWMKWALAAEVAEVQAQNQRQERAARHSRMKHG